MEEDGRMAQPRVTGRWLVLMRNKAFMAAATLALVLGACTKSADGQIPTPEMLSDALPTITEMPGDWDESQRQVFTTRGAENPSIDPSVWCPAAEMVTGDLLDLAGESGADVEMQARAAGANPRLMRLQAWANNDVEAYFRDAKEAVNICDGETVTDADAVVSTYDVIDGRDIGDESISWLQTTTPPVSTQKEKMSSIGRTTIARFGSIIMVMQMGDVAMGETSTLMAEEDWWDIVELAGKKLDDLDEQVRD